MAFKFIAFAALLAYANAGIIGAPAVATYSAGPAVSSSYFHQASAPITVAKAVAPVVSAYSAPVVSSYSAPVVSSYSAPVVSSYSAPVISSYATHAAPLVSTYAASPVAVHAPSIGASHQSVERSLGGAQSVSHYSKAVDSAFSSVRKFDTRVTNDGFRVAAAPLAVAHAPVVSTYAASPLATYASHSAPVLSAYSAAPVVAKTAVAYSPAAVVSHAAFSGFGASYQW